jgi:hypothetical protein
MRKNPVLSGALAAAAVLLLVTFTLLLVLRRERGQGLVLRHQEHLVAVEIAADRGAPGGPPALLACLTGIEAPLDPPNAEIVQELQRAAADQPDDPQAPQMLTAFVEDPGRGRRPASWPRAEATKRCANSTARSRPPRRRVSRRPRGSNCNSPALPRARRRQPRRRRWASDRPAPTWRWRPCGRGRTSPRPCSTCST